MPTIPGLRKPDQYLTHFSVQVAQGLNAFRTIEALPTVNVNDQAGIYRVFDSDTLREIKVGPVASGTQTTAGDFSYSKGHYYCSLRGLHVDLTPEQKLNASDIDLGRDATNYLVTQKTLEQETRFVKSFMTAGVWDSDRVGKTDFVQFDDAASDPIATINDQILRVQITSGIRPNTLWTDRKTFNKIIQHPAVIDRINRGQTTGPAVANETTVAMIFGLEKVIVIDAVVREDGNTNKLISENKILLAYVNNTAGTQSATAMARINWVGINRYMTTGNAIYRMQVPMVDGTERLEIKYADQLVVTAPALGVLLTDVLSK